MNKTKDSMSLLLLINVKGLAKTRAAFVSDPWGKSFIQARHFIPLKSFQFFNGISSAGLSQTKSRGTIDLLFNSRATVLKYSQKLFAMKLLSVDFDPFIINAEPCSEGNLVG